MSKPTFLNGVVDNHDVLRAMELILQQGPVESYLGICGNVAESVGLGPHAAGSLREDLYEKLPRYFAGWPYHSGEERDPIRDWSNDKKWEGRAGQFRYDLLVYAYKRACAWENITPVQALISKFTLSEEVKAYAN